MNWFDLHIGDYVEAAFHLTMLEDGAFMRLIRKYYSLEGPLPVEISAVQRLMACRSKADRDAVERVLQEFFVLRADGWHNERCDEVLAAYRAGEPDRQAKRENQQERKKRYNERRKKLFAKLAEHGQQPSWDATIEELQSLLERVTGNTRNAFPVHSGNTSARLPNSHSPYPTTHIPGNRNAPIPDGDLSPSASSSGNKHRTDLIIGSERTGRELDVSALTSKFTRMSS